MDFGPLAKPFGEDAPKAAPPAPNLEPSYMDGSVSPYVGANPGRDQDRSRVDERQEACYRYSGGPSGSEPSESSVDTGF